MNKLYEKYLNWKLERVGKKFEYYENTVRDLKFTIQQFERVAPLTSESSQFRVKVPCYLIIVNKKLEKLTSEKNKLITKLNPEITN